MTDQVDFTLSGAPDFPDANGVGGTPVELVRYYIGDTNKKKPLLPDGVIQAIIDNIGATKLTLVSAICCDMIAAKFGRETKNKRGKVSADANQKYEQYKDLAKCLREGGVGLVPGGDGTGVPGSQMLVGGASLSEQREIDSDPDFIKPWARLRSYDRNGAHSDPRTDDDPDEFTSGC